MDEEAEEQQRRAREQSKRKDTNRRDAQTRTIARDMN